jgi:hypothetical protein
MNDGCPRLIRVEACAIDDKELQFRRLLELRGRETSCVFDFTEKVGKSKTGNASTAFRDACRLVKPGTAPICGISKPDEFVRACIDPGSDERYSLSSKAGKPDGRYGGHEFVDRVVTNTCIFGHTHPDRALYPVIALLSYLRDDVERRKVVELQGHFWPRAFRGARCFAMER